VETLFLASKFWWEPPSLSPFEQGKICFRNSQLPMVTIFPVIAMGLIGVVAIDIVTFQQDAEAKTCQRNSIPSNASLGRCEVRGPN
jgi:hypothetical protein